MRSREAASSIARDSTRRFFLPFYTPPIDVPYRIAVNPGDTAVPRGKAVTLVGILEPTRGDAVLPTTATRLITATS